MLQLFEASGARVLLASGFLYLPDKVDGMACAISRPRCIAPG